MLGELDELINRFIDKFVLPLPLFIFHFPAWSGNAARSLSLKARVMANQKRVRDVQKRQAQMDAELRAVGVEPDDERIP
jgi:hypothetical protein